MNVCTRLHNNGRFLLFSLSFTPKPCVRRVRSKGFFGRSHSKTIFFKYLLLSEILIKINDFISKVLCVINIMLDVRYKIIISLSN